MLEEVVNLTIEQKISKLKEEIVKARTEYAQIYEQLRSAHAHEAKAKLFYAHTSMFRVSQPVPVHLRDGYHDLSQRLHTDAQQPAQIKRGVSSSPFVRPGQIIEVQTSGPAFQPAQIVEVQTSAPFFNVIQNFTNQVHTAKQVYDTKISIMEAELAQLEIEKNQELANSHDELKQLMQEILSMKNHNRQDGLKYSIMHDLNQLIAQKQNYASYNDFRCDAKNFIYLALQRNSIGFKNTTESGRKIRELLATPKFSTIREILFGKTSNPITYSKLRVFACGSNDEKRFGRWKKLSVFNFWKPQNKPVALQTEDALKHFLTIQG